MASPSDHKAIVIDGKAVAQTIRSKIASEVRQLLQKYRKVPGLAVVIVGNRKDSQSYVCMKRKACAEVGIISFDIDLPEQVSEAELISKVHDLNANPDVHDWLVAYMPHNCSAHYSFTLSLDLILGFLRYSELLGC